MKTTTKRNSVKPLLIELSPGGPGMAILASIRRGGDEPQSDYWMDLIPTDFGTGFRFRKIWDGHDFAEGSYDVLLDGSQSSCECKGFLRWGHCKHLQAAMQAASEGLAKPSPRPEEACEMPARVEPAGHYCTICKNFLAVEGEDLCYDCLYPF